ncbi:MAG TPA: hypothetical protein VLW85_08820 [Myxococcales bacterium]|nr:hypothetical protein [Myxococcales bacterium]
MRPGIANYAWGTALLGAVLITVVYFQVNQNPSKQLAARTQREKIAGELNVALVSAAEAEKSAVLAITDEDSQKFADQARAATAVAEQRRAELGRLLATGTPREQQLHGEFSAAFEKLQQIDRQVLDLAVRNTNIKAAALAFGPAAEAMRKMDAALADIIAKASSTRELRLAAGAQAAALRIQALLPPHIAEENEQKEDALEAQMARQDAEVKKDLGELGSRAAAAAASYARFDELRVQIIKLSRENTNVRSLALSLNEKRSAELACRASLAALEAEIAAEPVAGVRQHIVRPR